MPARRCDFACYCSQRPVPNQKRYETSIADRSNCCSHLSLPRPLNAKLIRTENRSPALLLCAFTVPCCNSGANRTRARCFSSDANRFSHHGLQPLVSGTSVRFRNGRRPISSRYAFGVEESATRGTYEYGRGQRDTGNFSGNDHL